MREKLEAYAGLVNAHLDRRLPSAELRPTTLHEAMRYSALAPGKRLRPALCLACAEAVSGPAQAALEAAAAIELVHCFSLIHDDLPAIDNDELRRGRPTCHVQYGEAVAILAGDALFALAFETLARTEGPPERVLSCLRILTHASGTDGLVGGETVDILSEGRPVDAETLEFIHTRKTASLIAAACEIGAILGGGSPAAREKLRRYGWEIGLAFQIADDVLNETSTEAELGKSAGSDRERQKATYPALHGLEASVSMARAKVELAIEQLADLPGSVDFLRDLARFTVQRRS